MIETEDILRNFEAFDSPWSTPLAQKDLKAIAAKLNQDLEDIQAHINQRIDDGTPPVRLEPLFKGEPKTHTSKQKAFLQTFTLSVSNEMIAMVYFIAIENAEIKALTVNYICKKSFALNIELALPSGKKISFRSDNIWDIEVIRRLGVMKMNDKPLFAGYFLL